MTISIFLNGNFAGRESVGWYIQNIGGKTKTKTKLANQEYYTQETCPLEMKKREIFTKKAEGVHYH